MNKLLFPASVQMLQASITLAHQLKRTLPNNKPGTNSSQIHWPWPINQAFFNINSTLSPIPVDCFMFSRVK